MSVDHSVTVSGSGPLRLPAIIAKPPTANRNNEPKICNDAFQTLMPPVPIEFKKAPVLVMPAPIDTIAIEMDWIPPKSAQRTTRSGCRDARVCDRSAIAVGKVFSVSASESVPRKRICAPSATKQTSLFLFSNALVVSGSRHHVKRTVCTFDRSIDVDPSEINPLLFRQNDP